MIHANQAFSSRVEAEVARIEMLTDAEVVVVAAERSGVYADLPATYAFGVAMVGLIGLMLLPYNIVPLAVIIDLMVVWVLSRVALSHPIILRRLIPAERQRRQVQQAAAAEFHVEAVHATPRRTGLLVYVSALEGRVELIPDVGLEARIPRGKWSAATEEFTHDDLDHFIAGLARIGTLLEAEVPHTQHERVDLANAPRIRS